MILIHKILNKQEKHILQMKLIQIIIFIIKIKENFIKIDGILSENQIMILFIKSKLINMLMN